MIYHIFTPQRIHLCPSIISGFATYFSNETNVFIMDRCSEENKIIYNRLSKELLCRMIYIDDFNTLSKIIPDKQVPFLLHSLNTEWLIGLVRMGYHNIHVVNWGHIPSKRNKFVFWLKHPILAYSYRQIKSIVALMQPDFKPLKEYFPNAYVTTISYLGNSNRKKQIDDCLLYKNNTNNDYVYVGNNAYCLNDYINIAENVLYKFRDRLKVLYMLNYALVKNDKYYHLLDINKDYNDAFTDEVTHPKEQYVSYMNNCDIYICSRTRQTGLAALHTCLQLGKKVFLDGPNYSYASTYLKCKVYHVSEIKNMSYEAFVEPLTEKEKNRNRQLVEEELSNERLIEKWQSYFKYIENGNK